MADTPPLPEDPNGLQQQPVPPLPSTPLSPPQGFFIEHPPSVRLSSSPASSPRIVGSPPTRTHSIHPETGSLLVSGLHPGANFLELTSDDDSEWEDDNGTRNFSDVEALANRVSAATFESTIKSEDWVEEEEEEDRGRKRHSEHLTALPPFNQIPPHDSGTEFSSPPMPMRRPPSQARQMSLKRYSRVNVVHNRGSPRSSILSNASSDVMPMPLNVSRTASQNHDEDDVTSNRFSNDTQRRHHMRSASESESIRMSAFLNAHYATLRALDSQPNSPPPPQFGFSERDGEGEGDVATKHQRSFSFSNQQQEQRQRHIKLLPPLNTITIDDDDPHRPPHLPAHFIKTPYPFTPKKEFPPPETRPRRSDLGIIHAHAHAHAHADAAAAAAGPLSPPSGPGLSNPNTNRKLHIYESSTTKPRPRPAPLNSGPDFVRARRPSTASTRDSTLLLSFTRRCLHHNSSSSSSNNNNNNRTRIEPLTIPSSHLAASPTPLPSPASASLSLSGGAGGGGGGGGGFKPHLRRPAPDADYDDAAFGFALRRGYARLAGPWVLRVLSARGMVGIRVGSVGVWSGIPGCTSAGDGTGRGGGGGRGRGGMGMGMGLLASGSGIALGEEGGMLFTEDALMGLYRAPETGRARYSWVHWGRRVAHSLSPSHAHPHPHHRSRSRSSSSWHAARPRPRSSSYIPTDCGDDAADDARHADADADADAEMQIRSAVLTLHFTHAFSPLKILLALLTLLALAVGAALVYIFAVPTPAGGGTSRGGRGSGGGTAERVTPGLLIGFFAGAVEGVLFGIWILGSWWLF